MSVFDWLETTRPYQYARVQMNKGLVDFLVRRTVADRAALQVAEVACGSGFAAHLMAAHRDVALSCAMDLNLDDYRQAAIPDFAAQFVLADLFAPPVLAESFDLVWNSSSIEEIPNPERAVACMAAMAKPGGLVFVGVPYKYGLAGLLGLFARGESKEWLGRNYSWAQLSALMRSAGLEPAGRKRYMLGIFIGILARKPHTEKNLG